MLKRIISPSNMQKDIGSQVPAERKKHSTVQQPSPGDKLNSPQRDIKNGTQAVRNKTSVVKTKPYIDLNHSDVPPETIKTEIPFLSRKFHALTQHPSDTLTMKDNRKTISSAENSPGPKGKPMMEIPSSSPTAITGSSGSRKTITQPRDITETSKTSIRSASLFLEPFGSSGVHPYARKFSSLRLGSPAKDEYRKEKAESKKHIHEKVQVPVKTFHIVEPVTENKTLDQKQSDSVVQISSISTLSPSAVNLTLEKDQKKILQMANEETENKMLNTMQTDKNIQISPSASPVFHSPVSSDSEFLPSHSDEAGKPEAIDVKNAKHLGNIVGEALEGSQYTDSYGSDESEYLESVTDEFSSENDNAVNMNKADILKGNEHRSSRKGKQLTSKYKDSPATKGKFRRSRNMDLQTENDVPRKLKFRGGKMIQNDDGSISYVRRRRFKKKEVVENANGTSPDSEKVVLRHQEMQEKKDEQGLYNDVIEETASKLARSRNSKVKALVGAFETVISLQDDKISSQEES